MGPTKQKRPTRKRMLCSQFSVLGENTDAYCPLASSIHGTRQARLVHFKQQKFTSLDLRSRNAQREKECYVRSFQCWARTQTRTAHQLATSTERGKLDWCTSNNKNLPPWTYEAETPNAKKNVMFVVFSAGREHRRVLPISQLHPRNAASQTGALQTTKIYILGLTKQKRPTRKRMLCSQFSVLGENTDAYCPLASYIHGTRQARLVHFKQQKFTSLDLRSRNAQREKECYVRSFQCWARTQTRTAHQLATSTERGKLDWCTSNNKNLHPWTYEAETPNAKKNVMFVVFSAGREHRRVLPISQLHPRNAASQTGALQTTKIYLLGLTKQKRPTRKRMLCSQFSVLGENTDAYCPLASYIHGTRQARLVHFKQQKFTSLDLRSRNAQREKECYVRSFQCWARTQTRTAHQLATSTERGKLDWCTSNNKNLPPWTYEAETPNAKKNVMFVVFSAGREHRRVLPISQLHPRNAASQTGALQTTKIYILGLTKQKRPTRKRMLCSQFSVLGENTDAYCPLASYIHGTRQARLVHFKQQKFTSLDLRSRNAQREKECYVRSFQCWARTQTRTAHQLATSTERGKLDWCTSNNKNLPPWTYEAETPNAMHLQAMFSWWRWP